MPQRLVRRVPRGKDGEAHLVGVTAAGLDLEPAAGHLAHHAVVLRRFAGAGMETETDAKLRTDVPLFLDQKAERRVVRIRHVLLKAEGGRHIVDRHREDLAQREHDGGGLGGG